MASTIESGGAAAARLERANAWLRERAPGEAVLVVAAGPEAASGLLRSALGSDRAAAFGWYRSTLGRVAAELAMPALAERGLAPIGGLAAEAAVARVLHELHAAAKLGRYAEAVGGPGLPRAMARTLAELRMARVGTDLLLGIAPELAAIALAYAAELERARLADRAIVFELANEAARDPESRHPLLGLPTLLLDVAIETPSERELVAALAQRSPELLATLPPGDEASAAQLAAALGVRLERAVRAAGAEGALARLQRHLFEETAPPEAALDDEVLLFSAPGEGRECVEIARRLQRFAADGIPFDRMAILLRSPEEYRAHLEEALARAGIPAWFARGSTKPDPAGRAFLALLACAAERLSARRFAEYLSLGQVPEPDASGAPPAAPEPAERWVAPDEELLPELVAEALADAAGEPAKSATLRTPRKWETLLNDAAVIGGRERWERRLRGLDQDLRLRIEEIDDPEDPRALALAEDRERLATLRAFALPLIDALASFPERASWGEWLDRLSALAARALHDPERVLAVLSELAPMAAIGPVGLDELRLVLARRLLELEVKPPRSRYGRVFVAPTEAARGLAFDVVFVPGLAERLFPRKVAEDPILLDADRARLDSGLATNATRVAKERLALRVAVGAARRRVVLSYPRLDLQQSRPRVPSFYALEALRAAEGRLPGFDELAARAEQVSEARVGWPAPSSPALAIDEAEHDLALLGDLLARDEERSVGAARYLLDANPHLARALRFRARRWLPRWTVADGLLPDTALAKGALGALAKGALEALAGESLEARSFSPTALQHFAACPYRFFLHTVHRLAPREVAEAVDELDPLQRGGLVHTVQFELFRRLEAEGRLPVQPGTLEAARAALDEVLDRVAARLREELAPAIDRVWQSGIDSIRADLREWLRRSAEDGSGFVPWRFELAFGLPATRERDPHSVAEPVVLDCGLRLRGSIDLVERRADGTLRVTDHKTGKARFEEGGVIGGGETLQPVLYALAAEKLVPGATVESGRLSYCTAAGGFQERAVPLDDLARRRAELVASTIGSALAEPFLPALPSEGACRFCDYQSVCGPYEELRTRRKPRRHEQVQALETLRGALVKDAAARARIHSDLDATLFVEAAAGTGKTTALVGRLVSLLRSGRSALERIVAVTFTEKAAGEMKLRLRAEIEKARTHAGTSSDERAQLDRALEQLELARIMTIHAFCADLLHERPIEAGVDPLFEVADEDESARLLERAFDAWFQRVLDDPPEGVRRILRRRPRRSDEEGPREQLRRAMTQLADHRDFDAAWRRDPGFDRDAEIDAVMDELSELARLAARASRADDWLAKNLHKLGAFVDEKRLLESVRGARDHDELESELWRLARRDSGPAKVGWSWRGSPRTRWGGDLDHAAVLARRDAAKERLDALLAASEADLAACLREELRPAIRSYEELKARAGKLDFLDLLVRARDLVRAHAAVRGELQRRFTHFFVDEFQDTDPVQAELILLLGSDDPAQTSWRRVAAVPGKLFFVGDPKQSIYRFRRADVTTYEAVKRQLAAGGAEVLQLATSFRALPSLQEAVNAAFAPVMGGSEDGSQAEYVALDPFRAAREDRPALVALPVPRPYGDYGKVVGWRIEESCPDAVGAFVAWLVGESGWTVEDPLTKEPVPIRARHVCLLFRRFKSFGDDVTRRYVRALEARRIPHVLVGGRSFHDREEVHAIRNALAAIEWPDDELRVYATLRGPLFALGDDALLAYRHRVRGRFHTLRPHEEALLAGMDAAERAVAEALELLGSLHRGRNHRPIAETIARLLAALRAHAGIAIWPTGEQALANCLRTIDVARRFEARGAPSFRAFVEHLDAQAERGEAQDAPVVEEGTEGVRIMTVHKAKGLEFPVVVLADPTCNLVGRNPTRHVDSARGIWAEPLCGCVPHDLRDAEALELRHDREESVRLAYVAATRARDLLVVPTIGDLRERPDERWLGMLDPVLYPAFEKRREAAPAPGCPSFGEDSVRERPESATSGPSASVRPGLLRPEAGAHGVVWWDPSALALDVEEQVGLRQQKILQADEGGTHSDAGIRAHAEWQQRRSETLARGGAESIRLARVVDLAAERRGEAKGVAVEELPVAVEELPVDRSGRPGGRRFGSLVHAVLAVVDLEAEAPEVLAAARTQGRILAAAEEEIEAAAKTAHAALAHPLLRRAAGAARRGELRRETPILLRLEDGRLAEGVVDLAFREKNEKGALWTVVDFKTDRELSARRPEYEAQVALYAEAIARATGDAATGVLLVL